MKNEKLIGTLITIISILAILATLTGILSSDGLGAYKITTFRGENIELYGKGLYRDMSSDVAIQGIAQDYITLFFAVPALIISFLLARKGSIRGKVFMSGVLGYFLLTYLFYTAMAMYNEMFLCYVSLLSTSFFALILSITDFDIKKAEESYQTTKIFKTGAIFLFLNGTMVALLWISRIIPPLLNGKLYPDGIQHYTTMIVQGFDLGLFLPIGFAIAYMALKGKPYGRFFLMVYVVFLSFLMGALCSKIAFMASTGANVFPVIFIMPVIDVVSIIFAFLFLNNIKGVS